MRPPRILVIDDDVVTRSFVSTVLKQEGYQVHSTWNAELGLAQAKREEPDLMILDVYMPGKDGFTALAEFRLEIKSWRTKVLMLTSEDKMKNVELAFNIGADAYLTKPFNPEHLLRKVNELLTKDVPSPAA